MLARTRTSVVYLKRVFGISIAASCLLSAHLLSGQTSPNPPALSSAAAGNLVLGGGNLIDVKVFNAPELDASVRLSEDGDANLPLIGSVHVAAMTLEQAQKVVEEKLVAGGFLKEPHVSILVREFTTQTVSVMGEVQRPGAFPITASRRLMDAVTAAGGFTSRAGNTIVINHRDNAAPETITVSFDAQKLQQSNVELHPGDLVTVGKAGLVYVTGEVNKPGGFVLENGDSVTVLQALALAQGAKVTASLNKARIIRKTPQGPQEIQVALKDITAAKKPDFSMRADDILFIPNSAGKSAGRRSMESVLQVATGIMIYRP